MRKNFFPVAASKRELLFLALFIVFAFIPFVGYLLLPDFHWTVRVLIGIVALACAGIAFLLQARFMIESEYSNRVTDYLSIICVTFAIATAFQLLLPWNPMISWIVYSCIGIAIVFAVKLIADISNAGVFIIGLFSL